jgi:hypothetical protein
VAVKDERPPFPDSVIPFARELITACWAADPSDRPTFDVVDSLKETNFKVISGVNSSKIWDFVKEVERFEIQSELSQTIA